MKAHFPIVGVGASAGGLEAFTALLTHLPLDTGMAFVLVQHLDPDHESALAQILTRATRMPVLEVIDGQQVQPDNIYVIPPNTFLSIEQRVLKLEPRLVGPAPHHSVDHFFESLAQDVHERAIGVVLSGAASDGTLGLEAIRAGGGFTFAQDESAKYDSMPRSAIAAGCVDLVLSPQRIAEELARIAHHPDAISAASRGRTDTTDAEGPASGDDQAAAATEQGEEAGFRKIIHLLHNHTGVDFSLYKDSTIRRRINRRIVLSRLKTVDAYIKSLRGNTKELDALYADVLISVTSFFRNPEAFEFIARSVLPRILPEGRSEPLRIWVLGCSTGQEAYSLAMLVAEHTSEMPGGSRLQLFATDLNEALLEKARSGFYPRSIANEISPERLRRFFVEEDGGYRVVKSLRESVVFARQNLLNDPPFSRMDLISCRNLLIYIETGLQKKVMPLFHYALRPDGCLFLGASESVGTFTNLFEALDRKHKIFARRPGPTSGIQRRLAPGHRIAERPVTSQRSGNEPEGVVVEVSAQREADRITRNRFAPPSVLVNSELMVLEFRGDTGPFLKPPVGPASFQLLKMARDGLTQPLRTAFSKARKSGASVRKENVKVRQNGDSFIAHLEVVPLKHVKDQAFLVFFEVAAGEPGEAASDGTTAAAPRVAARATKGASSTEQKQRVAELEAELAETRDYLQSVQDLHEAAQEALQASSEEVTSANEELQSINEELETSKEELESANEELTIFNDEMAGRNIELNRLNSDLNNLQSSTRQAIVLMDRDLRIRRFSPQAERQLNLRDSDVGSHFDKIRHELEIWPPTDKLTIESLLAAVIADVRESDVEVRDREGCWYSLRARPYMTLDNRVDGAVLVLVDINALKQSEEIITAARDYAEAIVSTMPEPMLILDHELKIRTANAAFHDAFKLTAAASEGARLSELGGGDWNITELLARLERVLLDDETIDSLTVEQDFESIGPRIMLIGARRLQEAPGGPPMVLMSVRDITTQRRNARDLERVTEELVINDRRKNEFLAMLAHELRNPLAPLRTGLAVLHEMDGADDRRAGVEQMMNRQVQQMVHLVDDLLDVSRVSSGKITLRKERVDLADLLREAAEAVQPVFAGLEQQLTVELGDIPLPVHGDPVRLTQVVGNLLNNASKFSEPGGRMELRASVEDGNVVIEVQDQGVGIGPEDLQRIFELFAQVDSSLQRSTVGLGLGLTLVKSLVELHGGTVAARSAGLGAGTTVVVHLPLLNGESNPAEPVEVARAGSTEVGRKLLIVDDNRDSTDALEMILGIRGYTVRVAYDGMEGVAVAASFRPEVILLDIGLPHLSGYEVARRIRSEPWGRDIHIVALTGWGQEEDRVKSSEAGFDLHLVKPVDPLELIELLAKRAG